MTPLKKYLSSTGTTQASLAAAVGISRCYTSELVAGSKTPSLAVAVRIEKFTDGAVTAGSLLALSAEAQ